MLSFNRRIHFSSGYQLHDSRLSPEENRARFGEDHGKSLGGNFRLDAHFMREGFPAIDPRTGMIVSLTDVDLWLSEIRRELNSQSLNDLLAPEVPTLEKLANFLAKAIEEKIAHHHERPNTLDAHGGRTAEVPPVVSTRNERSGFVIRLHKLNLSKAGRPGSLLSLESVALNL